jgi:hypothetical protein
MNSARFVRKDCNSCSVSNQSQQMRWDVCNCNQVTCEEMERIGDKSNVAPPPVPRENYRLGSRSASRKYKIKNMALVWLGIKTSIHQPVPRRRFMICRKYISTTLALSSRVRLEDPCNQ